MLSKDAINGVRIYRIMGGSISSCNVLGITVLFDRCCSRSIRKLGTGEVFSSGVGTLGSVFHGDLLAKCGVVDKRDDKYSECIDGIEEGYTLPSGEFIQRDILAAAVEAFEREVQCR